MLALKLCHRHEVFQVLRWMRGYHIIPIPDVSVVCSVIPCALPD